MQFLNNNTEWLLADMEVKCDPNLIDIDENRGKGSRVVSGTSYDSGGLHFYLSFSM